jgi:hypothetical protein
MASAAILEVAGRGIDSRWALIFAVQGIFAWHCAAWGVFGRSDAGQLRLRYVLVPESGTLAPVRCPFFGAACFGCQIFGLLRARRLVFLARSFFAAVFTRNNFYARAAVFSFGPKRAAPAVFSFGSKRAALELPLLFNRAPLLVQQTHPQLTQHTPVQHIWKKKMAMEASISTFL